MQKKTENTQESQNSIAPRVTSEPSDGGTAQLKDNRTSTIDQRKLHEKMSSKSKGNANPIQRKASPEHLALSPLTKLRNHGTEGSRRTNKTGLPDNLKWGIENLSGFNMGDVKVHYNSSKPAELQAHAYAQGTDIHLAPGQEKHLPHEAWHVVQQKKGEVQPTKLLNSKVNINDDAGLEKEADVMGNMALQEHRTKPPSIGYNFSEKRVLKKKWVQRKKNEEEVIVADYKDFAFLEKLSLKELDAYANRQADWHASPSLVKDSHRNFIRKILEFFRSKDHVSSSCKAFKVADIIAIIKKEGEGVVFTALEYFSNLKARSDPFEIRSPFDLKGAILAGKKIKSLLSHFPKYILKTAMYEEPFNELKTINDVEMLNKYYKKKEQPTFQSSRKHMKLNDFGAYLTLKKNIDPLKYDQTNLNGKIRNYHRFEKPALYKLIKNMETSDTKKPLTLILHSALDNNGAFLHDRKLTNLINNDKLRVIMVEGYETLSEYKNQVGLMAKKYGVNSKIDQVMFAGHGSSRKMQLGGKVAKGEDGKIEEVHDGIDLEKKIKPSKEIFNEVLDHMDTAKGTDKQPHRRVLFNACLTNSNILKPYKAEYKDGTEVKPTYNLKKAEVSKIYIVNHYRKWLNKNKNLVDTFMDLANEKKVDITKVVGSVASFGEVNLFDKKNNLDLISQYDKELTTINKINYVKDGLDPESVIVALHELWFKLSSRDLSDYILLPFNMGKTTSETLLNEVKKRSEKKANNWNELIIISIFKLLIVPENWKNSNYIYGMSQIAEIIYDAYNEMNCKVDIIKQLYLETYHYGIDNKDLGKIFSKMLNSEYGPDGDFFSIVFLQVFMSQELDNSKLMNLIFYIDRNDDIKFLWKFIDINFLASKKILKKILEDKNEKVAINIALIGALKKNTSCKKFLKKKLVDNKFPKALNIGKALGSLATELKILEILGVYSPPTEKSVDKALVKNIKSYDNGENFNNLKVKSTTKTGEVKNDNTHLQMPEGEFVKLKKGTICYILGSNGMWWAIEYTYKETLTTAFIKKDDVKTK